MFDCSSKVILSSDSVFPRLPDSVHDIADSTRVDLFYCPISNIIIFNETAASEDCCYSYPLTSGLGGPHSSWQSAHAVMAIDTAHFNAQTNRVVFLQNVD